MSASAPPTWTRLRPSVSTAKSTISARRSVALPAKTRPGIRKTARLPSHGHRSSGSPTRTVVPSCAGLWSANWPPRASMRSASPRSPVPLGHPRAAAAVVADLDDDCLVCRRELDECLGCATVNDRLIVQAVAVGLQCENNAGADPAASTLNLQRRPPLIARGGKRDARLVLRSARTRPCARR